MGLLPKPCGAGGEYRLKNSLNYHRLRKRYVVIAKTTGGLVRRSASSPSVISHGGTVDVDSGLT